MKQQPVSSYVSRLEAELHRRGAERETVKSAVAEVWSHVARSPEVDPEVAFGPVEQFAGEAMAGRPLRTRYLQRLSLALARQGVAGGRAGQVLAEVDEYVTDSLEDPVVAFGPPERYAAEVAATLGAARPAPSRSSALSGLLVAFLSTAGTLLAVEGLVALARGTAAPLTAGVLLAVLVLPPVGRAVAVAARRPAPIGPVVAVVALVATLLVRVTVLVGFREPVVTSAPAPIVLLLGLGLLAGLQVLSRRWITSALPEPVADPRPGEAAGDPMVWDPPDQNGPVRRTLVAGLVLSGLNVAVLTAAALMLR